MFRFDIVKPTIQEIIQEKQETKQCLKQVFYYNLLELERLRGHLKNIESEIKYEKDLYNLYRIGDRKIATGKSIERRKRMTKKIYPLLTKMIFKEYLEKKGIDKWDYLVLYKENEIKSFLSGKITYLEMIKKSGIL